MASLFPLMKTILFKPLSAIESVLSFAIFVYGVWINTPWYTSAPTTAIGAVFEEDLSRFIISLLYIIPPLLVLTGHFKDSPRLRSIGIFCTFLAYLFFSILRVATFGLLPIGGWIFTLALAVVVAIVFINFKLKSD